MKAKTSITLSSEVLARIDRSIGGQTSRSAFIEGVLREYFRQKSRTQLHARDLDKINGAADRLNQEALDTLEYQLSE